MRIYEHRFGQGNSYFSLFTTTPEPFEYQSTSPTGVKLESLMSRTIIGTFQKMALASTNCDLFLYAGEANGVVSSNPPVTAPGYEIIPIDIDN